MLLSYYMQGFLGQDFVRCIRDCLFQLHDSGSSSGGVIKGWGDLTTGGGNWDSRGWNYTSEMAFSRVWKLGILRAGFP